MVYLLKKESTGSGALPLPGKIAFPGSLVEG
jgi:hypothetical protein